MKYWFGIILGFCCWGLLAAAGPNQLALQDTSVMLKLSRAKLDKQGGRLELDSFSRWQPSPREMEQVRKLLPGAAKGEMYSFKISFVNKDPDTLQVFMETPFYDFLAVLPPSRSWMIRGDKVSADLLGEYGLSNITAFRLAPEERATYRILYGGLIGRKVHPQPFYLLSTQEFLDYRTRLSKQTKNAVPLHYIFMGALLIMMGYMLLLYLQNRGEPMYLFYGLYMLCILLYLGPKVSYGHHQAGFLPSARLWAAYTNGPIQWVMYIFYFLFVSHFLHFRESLPRLHRIIVVLSILCGLYAAGSSFYELWTGKLSLLDQLFLPSRVVLFLVSMYVIVDIWVSLGHALKYYVIVGSLFFMAGAMLSLYYSIPMYSGGASFATIPAGLDPISFMKIGAMLEVLFFALGVGRRIRLIHLEKSQVQKAYIQELQRNEALNRDIQQELSEKVEERTREIWEKSQELERERAARHEASLEQELSRSQMTNLRLQMNPHFIFNSLNSIRHLVLKKDFRQASAYIGEFARLLRLILHNSSQSQISLQDEIDTLRLYLSFEQRRFEGRLDYAIEKDPGLDTESVYIQPMMIQPFIENAVWHGLLHKEEQGKVILRLQRKKQCLYIEVEDNGIGRKKAQEIHDRKKDAHKSYGMSITKERLKLIERLKKGEGKIDIEDLQDERGRAQGTRVKIEIPV